MLREWIRGPVLDSRLYAAERNAGRNADLDFILSVYLNRVEPDASGLYVDANGGITPILIWPDDEWLHFRREFHNWVKGFFVNRFWLIPPRGYTGLDWPDGRPTHRPNVKCGLTLWVHERPEHARIGINCVYPAPGQRLRSNMGRESFGELDADDTTFQSANPVPTTSEVQDQVTVLHEVGHLLGLSHVNRYSASCPGPGQNAVACYGTTTWQRGDLMGWGSRVEHWHSWPWRNRIRYHTGFGGWTAVMARPEPQSLTTDQRMDAGRGIRDAGV
jgi:hypothetical protein